MSHILHLFCVTFIVQLIIFDISCLSFQLSKPHQPIKSTQFILHTNTIQIQSADVNSIQPPVVITSTTEKYKISKQLASILSNPTYAVVEVDSLVAKLEFNYIPIQTISFLTFALCGRWSLAYSNFQTPRQDKDISIEISQDITAYKNIISTNNNSFLTDIGNITNIVQYSTIKNSITYSGELHIESNYSVNSRGYLNMELQGHLLLPQDDVPPDAGEFVLALQRSMPLDLFDTSDLYLQHTYIDPNLRIVRIGGEQGVTGIYHIFMRNQQIRPE